MQDLTTKTTATTERAFYVRPKPDSPVAGGNLFLGYYPFNRGVYFPTWNLAFDALAKDKIIQSNDGAEHFEIVELDNDLVGGIKPHLRAYPTMAEATLYVERDHWGKDVDIEVLGTCVVREEGEPPYVRVRCEMFLKGESTGECDIDVWYSATGNLYGES